MQLSSGTRPFLGWSLTSILRQKTGTLWTMILDPGMLLTLTSIICTTCILDLYVQVRCGASKQEKAIRSEPHPSLRAESAAFLVRVKLNSLDSFAIDSLVFISSVRRPSSFSVCCSYYYIMVVGKKLSTPSHIASFSY